MIDIQDRLFAARLMYGLSKAIAEKDSSHSRRLLKEELKTYTESLKLNYGWLDEEVEEFENRVLGDLY